jgi:hypothetical protein
VYVRLAVDWADQSGAIHGAGEFIDIDVVTLAELEIRGVVDNTEERWVGPGRDEEPDNPSDEFEAAEAEAPDELTAEDV